MTTIELGKQGEKWTKSSLTESVYNMDVGVS